MENKGHARAVLTADKNKLLIGGIVLLVLGVLVFILTIFSMFGSWFYLVPITYIIAGVFGIVASREESQASLTIFKILVIILLIFNGLVILACAFFLISALFIDTSCDAAISGQCELVGLLYVILIILGAILVISVAAEVILGIFLHFILKFESDKAKFDYQGIQP